MRSFLTVTVFLFILLQGFPQGQTENKKGGVEPEKLVLNGLETLSDVEAISQQAQSKVDEINRVQNQIQESGAYQALVDGASLTMPYAVVGKDDNSDYALLVHKIKLDPVAGMTAEISMKIPYQDDHLYFYADNVPLTKRGKLKGELRLFLLKTREFAEGKSYKFFFKGLDNKRKAFSYVSFDCNGFKELYLNGKVEFLDMVQPGTKDQTVIMDFFINADRMENFILQFNNVPVFEFKKLNGFLCSVPRLVVDKSEVRNAPGFKLPDWYLDSLSVKMGTDLRNGEGAELYSGVMWEGVYADSIYIEIPKKFKEGSEDTSKAMVDADDLIIDQQGVTFLAHAMGEPALFRGDLKGFQFQMDSVRLNLIASTLSRAGLYGEMSLPICKERSTLEFGIRLSQNLADQSLEYYGYAKTDRKLEAEAFGLAQLTLDTSLFELEYKNDQFYPAITADGGLLVGHKKKGGASSSGYIDYRFEKLLVSSQYPYLDFEDFYIKESSNSSKMGKLPVRMSRPALPVKDSTGQKLGIKVGIEVSFQGSKGGSSSSANGFSGDGDLVFWTKRDPVTKRWVYDGFQLDSLGIEATAGPVEINGYVKIFEGIDVYNRGYCGQVRMNVLKKFEVYAEGVFGKAVITEVSDADLEAKIAAGENVTLPSNDDLGEEYRYWYVNAGVQFQPSIPIFTGLNMTGISGGAYYNMEILAEKPESVKKQPKCLKDTTKFFIPKLDVRGFMAGLGIECSGGKNTFNGTINLGVELNTGGGIRKVCTWGDVKFISANDANPSMAKLKELSKKKEKLDDVKDVQKSKKPQVNKGENESSIMGKWYVEYDFPKKTLIGDFDVYVNAYNVVTGVGADDLAGHLAIFSSPSEWYVYFGEPVESKMVGIELLDFAKIQGYLCFGSVLPDPPIARLPPQVAPQNNIDYNLVGIGGGISFGARLEASDIVGVTLPPCNFEPYLGYEVLAGFDLLLAQSNTGSCGGRTRGIDGWFATGQAYFYGSAALGIKYRCRGLLKFLGSGTAEIMSFTLRAYLLAQLPRPSYFEGELGVSFSFLIFNLNANFKLKLGDRCPTSVLASEVSFIHEITPVDGTENVEGGQKIHIYFSKPIETFEYTIKNDNSPNGLPSRYRAYVNEDLIKVKHGNVELPYLMEMSRDRKQVTLTPMMVYPGDSDIDVVVNVQTQIKLGDNWFDVPGQEEREVVTFHTAPEKDHIPIKDIYYAYPSPNMQNFYRDESIEGFIRLATLPRSLVELREDYEFSIAFYEGNNMIGITRGANYNSQYGADNFTFDMPTQGLETSKEYTFKILKTAKLTYTTETESPLGNELVHGTIQPELPDTVILEYNFTTSKYTSFTEKMAMYNTSISEVFDGVVSSELSINNAKKEDPKSFETFTDLETKGYVVEGIRRSSPFIHFGNISYNSGLIDFDLSTDVNLQNNGAGGYSTTSSMLEDLNRGLKDVNVDCLLGGGCSANEREAVLIPNGEFMLPLGYYLPGKDTPTSVVNLMVDLEEPITLPY